MTDSKKIETSALTEEQQAAFIEGWENAGGYIDDLETSCPWCCPWFYAKTIIVDGETPEQWGASWWDQCKNDVEENLKETE